MDSKNRQSFDEIVKKATTKKSIVPPSINPETKNGFNIWNPREKKNYGRITTEIDAS